MRVLPFCLLFGAIACDTKGEVSPGVPRASAPALSAASAAPATSATPAVSAGAPAQVLPPWSVPPPELGQVLELDAAICSRWESLQLRGEPSRSFMVDVPAVSAAKLEQHFRSFAKSVGLPVIEGAIVGMRVEAKSGRIGASLAKWGLTVTVLGEPRDQAGAVEALLAEGPPDLRKIIDAAGLAAITDLNVTRFTNNQREIRVQLSTKKSVAELAKAADLRDYGDEVFASAKKALAPMDWQVSVSKDTRGAWVSASQPLAAIPGCKLADEWSGRPDPKASADPSAVKQANDDLMKEMMGE